MSRSSSTIGSMEDMQQERSAQVAHAENQGQLNFWLGLFLGGVLGVLFTFALLVFYGR